MHDTIDQRAFYPHYHRFVTFCLLFVFVFYLVFTSFSSVCFIASRQPSLVRFLFYFYFYFFFPFISSIVFRSLDDIFEKLSDRLWNRGKNFLSEYQLVFRDSYLLRSGTMYFSSCRQFCALHRRRTRNIVIEETRSRFDELFYHP